MTNIQEEEIIFMAGREKQKITHKVVLIRLAADFSTERLSARRDKQEIFQVIKTKGLHHRLLHPARLSKRVSSIKWGPNCLFSKRCWAFY